MNRDAALDVIRSLAVGLEPDLEGTRRLLERISVQTDAELLRAVLIEQGAQAVLDGGAA